jgi:hypothetical protein
VIQSYAFGRMVIEDNVFTRDLKIIDGRVVGNWYREGGHLVSVEDVGDILSAAPDVVVFGTGYHGQMKITNVLENTLNRRNIAYIAQTTPQAKQSFNRMVAEGKRVAGAFHLTC